MWNIFLALITLTLAFAFMDPNFFVAYLVSIAVFGLFQAIYMANAGGSWDNSKKVVEVDLKEKNTPLHEAAVIGDTVGDPFKDTSSVSLNPIIKFSTLFGLLATEICIEMKSAPAHDYSLYIAIPFLAIGLAFVWRSFYSMRITTGAERHADPERREPHDIAIANVRLHLHEMAFPFVHLMPHSPKADKAEAGELGYLKGSFKKSKFKMLRRFRSKSGSQQRV